MTPPSAVKAPALTTRAAVLRERGADLLLDSAAPFRDAVRAASGGGVASVLDTVGGGPQVGVA